MTPQEARIHLRYSTWASRRLLDAALQLSPEQRERDMNIPNKNLLGTLAHIHSADRTWLARVLGQPVQPPQGPLEKEWPETLRRWEEWSESPAADDLNRVIEYRDLKGNPHRAPLWQIVLHLVNHASLHRGQAMALFRQLGAAPPATDLIFYYREQFPA